MARLPDTRAKRSLNPGSTPQVSVDRSALAQAGQLGGSISQAGDRILAFSEQKKKREQQKEDFGIAQEYEQMQVAMGADREAFLEQAPADGTGFTDKFMTESFTKRRDEFLAKVPERNRERYSQVMQTDLAKWSTSTAKIERDRLYEHSELVIGEQQNTYLNNISLDAGAYDESLASGFAIIDAAPIPEGTKELARRDWEANALTALAQRMIADDPETAKKALGGGSEATGPASNQAAALLREFEGFREGTYWDVNAHRTGYGSDTITKADGSVHKVRKGDKVSRADAERDLARRTKGFENTAIKQVGGKYWGALPVSARAALTSVAYNYGSLPDKVANAVKTGDVETIASAVEGLKGHNNGVNSDRRQKEAAIIRGSETIKGNGSIDPVFAGMDFNTRMKALNLAERQIDATEKFDDDQQRLAKAEITKTGYDLMLDDAITSEWVEENRDILNVSDYKALLRATVPGESPKRTDPKEYIRLLDLADSDPEQAIEEVRQQYGDDLIAKDVFNKIYSRANANVNRETGNRYESEMRQYVRRMLSPEADAPRSHYSRQLDAAFAFDDWFGDNDGASREDMRTAADGIIGNYKGLRYGRETTEMRPPRFLDISQPLTPKAFAEAKAKTVLALKLSEQGGPGMTKQELAEEAQLLRLWGSTLRE
ncbi:MAG: hypothetical protein NXI17_23705 [Alphaproteobacteria bacterium]|nr:hypothetical protein [Alphaproteobacteria bacterium]